MNCLSVQSHVSHGYVGNRAAVFPLQLLGWDVDVINTVQLSNNTGYGSWTGSKATAEEIRETYRGLKDKNFEYTSLLTGYVPSAEALEVIGEIGADIKRRFPSAMWLLDPVMGDDGQLYVSESVIPVYKQILKSGNVSVITPNAFEAEILCDYRYKLDTRENIHQALEYLHTEFKVEHIVLSSVQLPGSNKLMSIGSSVGQSAVCFEYTALDSYFTGTGDLFAALMIDRVFQHMHSNKSQFALRDAMQDSLAIVHSVLVNTMDHKTRHNVANHGIKGDPNAMKNAELQLIASRRVIMGVDQPLARFTPSLL